MHMDSFDKLALSKEEYQLGWTDAYSQMTSEHLWKQQPIEFLAEYANKFKELRFQQILDVGCGDGRNAICLLQEGFQVTGIDLSPVALANALGWARKRRLGGGVFVNIDIESYPWPFPEGSFNAIVCLDVFGQVLDINNVVNNFYRAVAPGGYVLANLYTPQDGAFGMGQRLGAKSFLYKKTLWRFFTEEDIVKIFDAFQIMSIKSLSWDDPPHPGYRDEPHTHDSNIVLLRKAETLDSK